MKKQILIIFILFTSNSIFAQIDNIVGDWSEIMHIRIDTTDAGIDELKTDYQVYVKGVKKLDPSYTDRTMLFPLDENKLVITIKKEKDYFVATNSNGSSEKIVNYDKDLDYYQVYLRGLLSQLRTCKVEYDFMTDKLFFKDENYEIYYVFERKK